MCLLANLLNDITLSSYYLFRMASGVGVIPNDFNSFVIKHLKFFSDGQYVFTRIKNITHFFKCDF